jgi:hypothetical protein
MRVFVALLVLGLTLACTGNGAASATRQSPSVTDSSSVTSPTPASPTPVPTIGPLGAAGCRPASPAGAFSGEVYGTTQRGTMWAWFMGDYPPRSGVEDKTIWRFDGPHVFGTPTFALIGPRSRRGHLNWGPAAHGSSTWNRPGVEFGTGLLFPAAGCWDVHITLDQLAGDVYVVVR